MSSKEFESLSALLDNEADELELQRVLNALPANPDLAETWSRMNLVQSVLHDDNLRYGGVSATAGTGLAEAVAAAIADEAVPGRAPATVRLRGWGQPLARVAIAASVALAFFIGVQVDFTGSGSGSVPVAGQDALQPGLDAGPAVQLAVSEPAGEAAEMRQIDPQARQRLENYIRSVSITRDEPEQLEQLQDSPLYRLVNEIEDQ